MPCFKEIIVKVINDNELLSIQESLRYMNTHQVNDWEIAESYNHGWKEQVLIACRDNMIQIDRLDRIYLYIKLGGVESLREASDISKKLIDSLFVNEGELKGVEITPTLIQYILL